MKKLSDISQVPDEIVRVSFEFQDDIHKQSYRMEFWAGFMGLSQHKKTMSLKSVIGSAVNRID